MTVWLISVNSNVYNHQSSFDRWGAVDWIQSANYEIGDIIYIYESRQAARIRYKTEVVLNNIPYSEKLDDEAFWHDDRGLARQNLKYSRLKLLKVIDSKELTLNKLRQHGLKNAPQLAKKLDGELLEFIEANEGNLNDVKVNYSFKPELIGSHLDGNIAIKCNYCDGGKDEYHIGFSGVCSDNVIKHNIEKEHRVWCSNERCPCYQYHEGLITRSILNEIMSTSSELVCYESLMLAEWKAQAGLSETGQTRRFGLTLHKGAACVFTTRLPDMPEKDRVVWGLFIIDELFRGDSQESGYVKCNTEYHIELTPSEAKQIKYWKYYRNKNNPNVEQWGTGLYRFMSNDGVIAMLVDLISITSNERREEVIRFLTEYCRLNNRKMPEVETAYRVNNIEEKSIVEFVSNESIKDDFEKQQLELEDKSIEETVENNNLVGMDRVAVVKTRVNQGVFRDRLIRKYNKCCICGVDDVNLLVASHIKPWVDSEPDERVDDNNGLLLCPNHDRLFDRGYISFDDAGNILISKALSETNQIYLNVNPDSSIELSEKSRPYMKYHRENIFLDKVIESKKEESTQVEIDNSESAAEPITDKPSNNASFGALPNCLLNRDVKDINNKRIGKIINIDGFYLRVKFYDDSKTKDFVFPQCFMKNRLSVRDESLRKYLDEYLEDFV